VKAGPQARASTTPAKAMLAQQGHVHTARENRPQTGKASSDAERNWQPAAENVLAAAIAACTGGRTVRAGQQAQSEVPPASGYDGEPLIATQGDYPWQHRQTL
jgi:hypothetical protein